MTSPRPSRDDIWTRHPRAAAILADMASNPPKQRTAPYEGLTLSHKRLFVGGRVQELSAIHRAESERILAECDATGDHAPFTAHCALTVQSAIADIIKTTEHFRRDARQGQGRRSRSRFRVDDAPRVRGRRPQVPRRPGPLSRT
jgi:hypothetical protein